MFKYQLIKRILNLNIYNMISNMLHNKFEHTHVLIIMWLLIHCVISSSTSTTIPTFLGKQLVAIANKQIKCTNKERNALIDFKAGLQDPFDKLFTWRTYKKEDVDDDDDCCKWSRVTCNNQTGHVTKLDLSYCDLEGEISHSLLNLTYLTLLDLRWNSFNGTIPNSIGSLTQLRGLYLSVNSLNGIIAESIGYLTELRELDLSSNSLNGTIPESIGHLTELRELYLAGNFLNGPNPEPIGYLTELRKLYLSSNSFIGTIPESIGHLTKLTDLHLSNNSFSGTIPESIGYLTELMKLDLSRNSFSGTIPLQFGNLINLEALYLDNLGRCSVENISWLSRLSHLKELLLDGISLTKADHWVNVILSLQNLTRVHLDGCDLSRVMHPYSSSSSHINSSSFSSNIGELSLGNNNLNSSMYPWLYPLTKSNRLRFLSLHGNKLVEFPKYFGNLCNLSSLYLNNSANVPFSDFLKTLSTGCTSAKLRDLVASGSQFTGSVSDDIQNFSSLEGLILDHNRLNGTISEKVWELPMLSALNISSNYFRGNIFEKIDRSMLSNNRSRIIRYMDISSNNFGGKAQDLSTVIGSEVIHLLSTFTSSAMDLSSNNFYGPVTNVSSTLNLLNLSKNKFYGGISFLCQIVDGSLKYLDLSYNSFSGQIPDCLWHLKNLELLNLANNNLGGRFPASFGYLIQLDVLDLYSNSFTGELPLSLRNCTMLTFLDLGSNRFSGNVPVWIGENLLGLYLLSLGSNNFFGSIPLQFCQLVNLQILDLSMNNLNGTIPSCLNNLTSMAQQGFLPSAHNLHRYKIPTTATFFLVNAYIDNAIVQWQGIRREFTSNLGLLKSIDLSSNNLTGKIPNELTNLFGLLALNLSSNALLGEIPQKIGQVKDLLTLDLSRNHFSGRIPSSISEMTSLNCLDVSYNNLSGRIPSSTQLQSFETSRYTGNAELCGPPLSKHCPGDEELEVPYPVGERKGEGGIDELERWFYIGGAIGFAIGFWIVCITLLVNRCGRHTFFRFMDNLENCVYEKVFKAHF